MLIRFLAWERWKSIFRRYFWFLLPLCLVILFPATRHFPRQHILGTPLAREYNQSWTFRFDDPERYAAEAIAAAHPQDLQVKIARIWREQCGTNNNYYYGLENALTSGTNEKRAQTWSRELRRKYPQVPWLDSLRLLMLVYGSSPMNPQQVEGGQEWRVLNPGTRGMWRITFQTKYTPGETREWQEFIQLARQEAQREPDNAFPRMIAAQLLFQAKLPEQAAAMMHQAARCRTYNDHSLEIADAVLRSYESVRSLSALERSGILEAFFARQYEFSQQPHLNLAVLATNYHAKLLRQMRGRAAVSLTEDMVACANLLGTGRSCLKRNTCVQVLVQMAFQNWLPLNPVRGQKSLPSHQHFLNYCRKYGLKARAETVLQQRLTILHRYPDSAGEWYTPIAASPSARNVKTLMDTGTVFLVHGGFVLSVWLGVAILLFRGIGQPSTRRDRVFVVLPIMVLASILVLAVVWWESDPNHNAGGARPWQKQMAVASLAGIGALLPVFGPVLMCAAGAWTRYRPLFELPVRLEKEMKLSRFDTGLLLRSMPLACVLVVVGLLASWAYWAAASWNGWLSYDLLGWMPTPPGGNLPTVDFDPAAPIPLAYFMALTLLISLLWLAKWLWGTAPHGKPATHFGVRWYKECLGAYIIGLAWLYLAVALISWPLSNRARNEWDQKVQVAVSARPV